MKSYDSDYTLEQRRDYFGKWVSALVFGCFFFAGVTFFGFYWRSNIDPWNLYGLAKVVVGGVWLWPIIFLAFVGVWWEQRKRVESLDERIEEAKVAERAKAEAKEKRAKAAAKKKRAEVKKKRESGRN